MTGFLGTMGALLIIGWLFGVSRLLRTGVRDTWLIALTITALTVLTVWGGAYSGR